MSLARDAEVPLRRIAVTVRKKQNMYSYGDNHPEPVLEERVHHDVHKAIPGSAGTKTLPTLARGGGKDVLRHATIQGTVGGSVLDAGLEVLHPWFLAYTRPGQEQQAQQNLSHQAYESYFPQYRRVKKTAGETSVAFEPLFPRYVFFRPEHAGQSITPVRSTRGVSHIVRFGEQPATVQPDIVDAIRQLEEERNMGGDDAVETLQPGQKVRLLDSVFQGLEGLVMSASRRRVAVLLEFLGRQQVVHASPRKVGLA